MEYSRTNENETTIEKEFCNIFPNQVFMEEVPWTKTMEKIYEFANIVHCH